MTNRIYRVEYETRLGWRFQCEFDSLTKAEESARDSRAINRLCAYRVIEHEIAISETQVYHIDALGPIPEGQQVCHVMPLE